MALVFVIGYAGIIFEESLAFNKSGVGLLMAVSLWVVRTIGVSFIICVDYLKFTNEIMYHLVAYFQINILTIN